MYRNKPNKTIYNKIKFNNLYYYKDLGRWQSKVIGDGLEFVSLREYQNGDPIKKINWNASARSGQIYVNQNSSLRSINIHLIIDCNITNNYGSEIRKSQIVKELIETILEIASNNQDSIKITLLSNKNILYPKRNGKVALYFYNDIIRNLIFDRTNPIVLDNLFIKKDDTINIFISDLIDKKDYNNYKQIIKIFKPYIITINDNKEFSLPKLGVFRINSMVEEKTIIIDTNDKNFTNQYNKNVFENLELRNKLTVQSKGLFDLYTNLEHGGMQFVNKVLNIGLKNA